MISSEDCFGSGNGEDVEVGYVWNKNTPLG